MVTSASDLDMARLMNAGVDLSQLDASVERVHSWVEKNRPFAAARIGKPVTDSSGFPSAQYSFCGSSRNSAEGMFAAQVVLDVAKGVWSVASRACDEVIVILGEGGNVSLVCIITDAVLAAAEAVFNGFQFCDNDIDSAEIEGSYERLDHIHTDLANAQSTIIANDNTNTTNIQNNDNSNRVQIIANDNTNTTKIINNDNANRDFVIGELRAVACEVIRLLNTPEGQRSSKIASCAGQPNFPYDFPEKKLSTSAARELSSVGTPTLSAFIRDVASQEDTVTMETNLLSGKMIASYYLPASRGGLIERVKNLVWNTLRGEAELNIAGDQIPAARSEAESADQLLSAGRYVDAYRHYAAAYQKLVPAF